MRELCQLLDPDARVAQHLDGGPCPERVVLLQGQVPPLPAAGIFGPDPAGGAGQAGPAQRLPADGEQLAGRGGAGSVQPGCGVLPPAVDGGGEGGQDGEAVRGSAGPCGPWSATSASCTGCRCRGPGRARPTAPTGRARPAPTGRGQGRTPERSPGCGQPTSLATACSPPPGVRAVLVWMRRFQPTAMSGGSRSESMPG